MPDLSGQTALVTGASRGMGRAAALALASDAPTEAWAASEDVKMMLLLLHKAGRARASTLPTSPIVI
jgi:NAD(P)-dependent dehydrogenase (short-subunit alcohol dehydrogenase family)